ncbi:hypothetical protein ACLB2K_033486 [Fragaria x ananassa]
MLSSMVETPNIARILYCPNNRIHGHVLVGFVDVGLSKVTSLLVRLRRVVDAGLWPRRRSTSAAGHAATIGGCLDDWLGGRGYKLYGFQSMAAAAQAKILWTMVVSDQPRSILVANIEDGGGLFYWRLWWWRGCKGAGSEMVSRRWSRAVSGDCGGG